MPFDIDGEARNELTAVLRTCGFPGAPDMLCRELAGSIGDRHVRHARTGHATPKALHVYEYGAAEVTPLWPLASALGVGPTALPHGLALIALDAALVVADVGDVGLSLLAATADPARLPEAVLNAVERARAQTLAPLVGYSAPPPPDLAVRLSRASVLIRIRGEARDLTLGSSVRVVDSDRRVVAELEIIERDRPFSHPPAGAPRRSTLRRATRRVCGADPVVAARLRVRRRVELLSGWGWFNLGFAGAGASHVEPGGRREEGATT
jgi:hypothetical protein